MPSARSLSAVATLLLLAVLGHESATAQVSGPSIWTGVFTTEQARQGQEQFEATCARCHNSDLSGDRGPALKGDRFMATWGSRDVSRLFSKIKESMPQNRPNSLSDEAYLAIVTHLLQANGFPAGGKPLTTAINVLETIFIVPKGGGPTTIPNFSLVATNGCLAARPGGGWVLTRSSAAAATKDEPATADELTALKASPPGQETFVLLSAGVFEATAHQGQRMQAKGLLYRTPDETRLSLTSLQVVSGDCGGAAGQ
jgi:cytochrome c5